MKQEMQLHMDYRPSSVVLRYIARKGSSMLIILQVKWLFILSLR